MARLVASQEVKLGLIATQLEAVMDWVHRRQIFVQLASQTYSSARISCDVRHEVSKVIDAMDFGDGRVLDFHCDDVVKVDKNVLNVVIEEGISNAAKYHAPGSPIVIKVRMEPAGTAGSPSSAGDSHQPAHASKAGGRNADGLQLLILEIRNQNPPDSQPLSAEDCRRVFEPGYKAHAVSAHSGMLCQGIPRRRPTPRCHAASYSARAARRTQTQCSPLAQLTLLDSRCSTRVCTTDGIGLDSVASACAAAGGKAYLSTSEDGCHIFTTFHVHLLAQELNLSENSSSERLPLLSESPSRGLDQSGLRSRKPARLLEHATVGLTNSGATPQLSDTNGTTGMPPAVAALSSSEPPHDGARDTSQVTTPRLSKRGTQRRGPLICVAVDDDPFLRMAHNMFFQSVLEADMSRSGAMGVSEPELQSFCDVIMGRKSLFGHADTSTNSGTSLKPVVADVLFIDHDLGPDATVMGTDLARWADAEGFPGLICIVTAATKIEQEQISRLPYVHLVVEKGFRPLELAERIQSKLGRLRR